MANNRKKRNANRKPEQAKTQGSLNDEVKEELKEEFKEDVKEDFEEETWEDSVEEAEQAMKRAELEKQSRENRQNLLLVLGVVAFLAIVGIVIFLTSGSSDEEQVAATGTTGEIAAADSTGDMDLAVVENIEEEGTEDAVEAATEAEVSGDEVQEIVEDGSEIAEGDEAAAEEGTEEGAPAEEGTEEGTPAEEGTEEAAPAEEVTSTTVLEPGTVYAIENPMTLYEEASADSAAVMELVPGWSVAVEEAAEAGNGWHRVSVWLDGAATYGYIQIP